MRYLCLNQNVLMYYSGLMSKFDKSDVSNQIEKLYFVMFSRKAGLTVTRFN